MITEPVYITRDVVITATDVKSSGHTNDLIDLVCQSASRQVDREAHRRFYPEVATRRWDWPNFQYADPWQLYLEDDEIISLTSFTAGGTAIAADDIILRRSDGKDEAPYNILEIDLSGSAALASGTTFQQALVAVGLFGHSNNTVSQGTITTSPGASTATVAVSDSTIGVGAQIIIGTERLLVRDKAMLDTAQNTTGALTANKGDTLVGVGSGSAFTRNEIILIEAEKMRVSEIAGNNLIVERAWDGTVLAAHLTNQDVYAPRTATVTRGFLGTTAAAHTAADAVSVWVPPSMAAEYALALALNDKRLATLGYSPGLTGNKELQEKREAFYGAYGRKARLGAV